MHCVKCGAELKESGVFCARCLEGMEKDPVRANTPVQLPVRPSPTAVKKKSRWHKYTKPEDQIRHLKKQLRWVVFTLVVTLVAFGLTAAMLIHILNRSDEGFHIGQNYETIGSSEPS